MKRILPGMSIMVLGLLFMTGLLSETAIASDVNSIAAALPQETQAMVQGQSLEALYSQLDVKKDSFMGEPVKGLDEVTKALGFNPLDIKAVKAAGFETDKPLGIGIAGISIPEEADGDPEFMGTLAFPVKDFGKAVEAVKSFLKHDTPEVTFKDENGMTIATQPDGKINGIIAQKKGYLFLGGTSPAPKSKLIDFMKSVTSGGKTLVATDRFRKSVQKIEKMPSLLFFGNIQDIVKTNRAAIDKLIEATGEEKTQFKVQLKYLEDYLGMAFGIDMSGPDLTSDVAGVVTPDSELLKLIKGLKFNRKVAFGVPDHPVILMSSATNAAEYYKLILEMLTEAQRKAFDEQVNKLKTEHKIDLKTDIIDNLAGDMNFGFYDGMTINMANYNALITLGVKDAAKAKAVLDKAVQMEPTSPDRPKMIQPTTVQGVEGYMSNIAGMIQIFAGIKDNALILASGKPMYDKALTANIAKGFISQITDKKLAGIMKSDKHIGYINMGELLKAFKNFSMMIQQFAGENPVTPEIEKELQKLDYLVSSSWPGSEGNTFYGNILFKTRFSEPFVPEFVKMVRKLMPEKKAETDTPATPDASEEKSTPAADQPQKAAE